MFFRVFVVAVAVSAIIGTLQAFERSSDKWENSTQKSSPLHKVIHM